ncbi:MAG: adenylate kinase family protein [Candidatus Nanohaloarchaea archaeon]
MEIALTGTPGTGKTSIARELEEQGFKVIDLTEFVKENGLGTSGDEFEVDVPEMVEALEEREFEEDAVIEGHLAHHYPADLCVVLRCRPDELEERLKRRDYSRGKVEDNVESEALDLVLQEAVREQETVIEVDTTGRDVGEVAEEVRKRIEKGDEVYGEVDWSEFL